MSSRKSDTKTPRFTSRGFFNVPQKQFIIENLRQKYIPRSSIPLLHGWSSDRKSPSSQTTVSNGDGVGLASPTLFKKKANFRDIVLQAAQHKPFRQNLDEKSQRRLSGLGHQARLERFRQVASRWKTKAKKGTIIPEALEEDHDIIIPEKPRFCATLSTEAQYAIFKGYEDALVHKISRSLPSSQKWVPIKRIPSARTRPTSGESSFPILENKPKIISVSSLKDSKKHLPESSGWTSRQERDHDLRYVSAHFKQAMNLLDEFEQHSYTEGKQQENAPKTKDSSVIIEEDIKQYNAWSQRWIKHFEFSC